jgi:putative ABC transport system substrate-binding protein
MWNTGYVDEIPRGARPADLPLQQPAMVELAINLTNAKAHGLNLPRSLLARANQVFE